MVLDKGCVVDVPGGMPSVPKVNEKVLTSCFWMFLVQC